MKIAVAVGGGNRIKWSLRKHRGGTVGCKTHADDFGPKSIIRLIETLRVCIIRFAHDVARVKLFTSDCFVKFFLSE